MKSQKGFNVVDAAFISAILAFVFSGIIAYYNADPKPSEPPKLRSITPDYLVCFDGWLAYHYDRAIVYKLGSDGKSIRC